MANCKSCANVSDFYMEGTKVVIQCKFERETPEGEHECELWSYEPGSDLDEPARTGW